MAAVLATSPKRAQYWIGKKRKLVAELLKVLEGNGAGDTSDIAGLPTGWQAFYRDLFGLELDFSGLRIPEKQEGFDRLLVVAEGMTPNKLYDKCVELFPCWRYTKNLDFITSDRDPKNGAYVLWVKDGQEADEELKNSSANDLKKKNVTTETLPERLLHELKYFKETGKHLDIHNWTFCVGSRDPSGYVPYVGWDGDSFRVGWCDPDGRNDNFRGRAAVS